MTIIDSFKGEYAFLSNFYPVPCDLGSGVVFPTAEHAYQASKSQDSTDWKDVMECVSPGAAKRMGKIVTMRPNFNQLKLSYMGQIIRAKFNDPRLADRLVETGDAKLIEGNHWNDTYWGVCKGVGQNMLGRLLMSERRYRNLRITYDDDPVFVFGSNLMGYHGKGAALTAKLYHGAQQGVGAGHVGQSYALPTAGAHFQGLSLQAIKGHIDTFLQYATTNSDLIFQVTQVGCGLAGHQAHKIAPLFENAPDNCFFDFDWAHFLGPDRLYWGSV